MPKLEVRYTQECEHEPRIVAFYECDWCGVSLKIRNPLFFSVDDAPPIVPDEWIAEALRNFVAMSVDPFHAQIDKDSDVAIQFTQRSGSFQLQADPSRHGDARIRVDFYIFDIHNQALCLNPEAEAVVDCFGDILG